MPRPSMTLLRGFDPPDAFRGGYVSIGNFDGVHRGHQEMIGRLVAHARRDEVPATVFTFDPHPIALLAPGRVPPSLSTLDRKAELLAHHAVDCLIAYPTDHEFLSLTAEEFFESIVVDQLDARGLVEGPNFHFGKGRTGDVTLLSELCEQHGQTLDVLEPVSIDGTIVSSSRIRNAIAAGHLKEAVTLLGHPYQLAGTVVTGDRRGGALGFPTANLDGVTTLLPADGVYAAISQVDGQQWATAVHIGANPTFGDSQRKIEAHLIGFDGHLYGQQLAIDLLAPVRETRSFASAEELQDQLRADIDRTQEIVGRR